MCQRSLDGVHDMRRPGLMTANSSAKLLTSDTIISLSKEMIILSSPKNPIGFFDDYFWGRHFGGHLKSFESAVMFGM